MGDVSARANVSVSGSLLAISERAPGARLVWFDRVGHKISTFPAPRLLRALAIQLLAFALQLALARHCGH